MSDLEKETNLDLSGEIKELGQKIDGHFSNWYTFYEDHERIELAMIKKSEERLNGLDKLTAEMKTQFEKHQKRISKHIKFIYILVGVVYFLILAGVVLYAVLK